ncbi:MAG: hypothetical protein HOD28_01675 [Candidatus Marinimicrobia bacterium]|jgi:hypothetical protein|nr:hypothetical protein [Candidatus Neomarinimicrobiota bacterium]MBT4382300.1 hypothetical protein [Candidatus Neomarinimicrobiota bacterium]MBT7114682.1 hypothetical protein [Candidatus Neomarinimicrobiota bacterium]MBT7900651.1 hypothetical protein [Candidatus Neomarinimicrobiota bacterium]MBT7973265.1 hypothetical protein [Candidatus Neomarinimicrobiota bacterium]
MNTFLKLIASLMLVGTNCVLSQINEAELLNGGRHCGTYNPSLQEILNIETIHNNWLDC